MHCLTFVGPTCTRWMTFQSGQGPLGQQHQVITHWSLWTAVVEGMEVGRAEMLKINNRGREEIHLFSEMVFKTH